MNYISNRGTFPFNKMINKTFRVINLNPEKYDFN